MFSNFQISFRGVDMFEMNAASSQPISRPKISLDYLLENASNRPESLNPYIKAFIDLSCAHDPLSVLRKLISCDDRVRKVFNHKSLKKEITESMAMAFALNKVAGKKLGIRGDMTDLNLELLQQHQFTFYDVCSGRGITSIIFRLFFPESRIVMIDFNQSINVEFLQASELASIEFRHMDIYQPDFSNFLVASTERDISDGRVPCIFGMHLCGQLSNRVIELFNDIYTIPILVVIPCCMPRRKKGSKVDKMRIMLKQNGWDGYSFWTLNLFGSIDSSNAIKNVECDNFMESVKCKIIWAHKKS